MRDSFVFYRGFYEAISDLDPETRAAVYDAICRYALDGVEPEAGTVVSAMFKMAKPQIDANNRRYENGKRGGRPRKQEEPNENQEEEPRNQTETKPKPNQNQTEPKAENREPNVNVNVNDNVSPKGDKKKPPKHKYGDYKHVLLTDDELAKLKTEFGEVRAIAAVKYLDAYIEEKGYSSKSHYLAIRRWVFDALDRSKKPQARSGTPNRFNNFSQREYDSSLESQILAAQQRRATT